YYTASHSVGLFVRMLNGFGGTRPGVAFPVGQTLGQTASFRQNAPETWCQSRLCGVLHLLALRCGATMESSLGGSNAPDLLPRRPCRYLHRRPCLSPAGRADSAATGFHSLPRPWHL